MDISKVTDYLYAGSRVGKEHADTFLTSILIKRLLVGVEAALPSIQIIGFETCWQKR
jgi:hypothetical protein